MKVYLSMEDDRILLNARAEGPAGTIGDMMRDLRPGDHWGAWKYDDLRALGDGEHDLTESPPEQFDEKFERKHPRVDSGEARDLSQPRGD